MISATRRQFMRKVGTGIGSIALGFALADRAGIVNALAATRRERLRFGPLDPLVDLLQATPADELLPLLVQKLRAGTPLSDLVGAGALANARAFGGADYNGYHALMAMAPAFEMAAQMPAPLAALPVLKVLHRNARFEREAGKSGDDTLGPIDAAAGDAAGTLIEEARRRDVPRAERSLAALVDRSEPEAYSQLQAIVRDDLNVHRVVLAWRAHDLQRLTGDQHALTLLRQSLRFCIIEDSQRDQRGQPLPAVAALVPKLMADHGLDGHAPERRSADDGWIAQLGDTIFSGDGATAATAAAAALAEGFDPEDVGAALSLAATRLLLHDPGLQKEAPGKPCGSVHGASVGVHASDAANAWRHIARLGARLGAGIGSRHDAFASLITGAYHTAGQSQHVGAQPFDHDADPIVQADPVILLRDLEGLVRERDQRGACTTARRYCELGHPHDALFNLLLGFAVSEDGALHAEKYFRTAQDECAIARPAHRAIYLVALTRVMASSAGFPAPGCEEARRLLTA